MITLRSVRNTVTCATQERIEYDYATDDEALAAFRTLGETEGIIPALETAHAIAHMIKIAPSLSPDKIIIVNCSGRGDKDVQQAAAHFGLTMSSMTGYGRGESDHAGAKFSVELNSVNRKQSDIVINLPRDLAALEPRIRQAINEKISRGRMNVVGGLQRGHERRAAARARYALSRAPITTRCSRCKRS